MTSQTSEGTINSSQNSSQGADGLISVFDSFGFDDLQVIERNRTILELILNLKFRSSTTISNDFAPIMQAKNFNRFIVRNFFVQISNYYVTKVSKMSTIWTFSMYIYLPTMFWNCFFRQ